MKQKRVGMKRFKPGVFDYSGCGMGTYWHSNGQVSDCTRQEAYDFATVEGIAAVHIDRLPGACHTSNWEEYVVDQTVQDDIRSQIVSHKDEIDRQQERVDDAEKAIYWNTMEIEALEAALE